MKKGVFDFKKFIKNNIFIVFAGLTLFFPDLQLRNLVMPKAFAEPYVAPVTWGFTACWIVAIVFVCAFMLPKKSGRITYIITAGLFIILSLCQYIYFKIFDQFFWLKSIALAGEGAEYLSYAVKYIDVRLALCTLVAVLFLVLAANNWNDCRPTNKKWWFVLLVPVLGIVGLHISMLPAVHNEIGDDWDSWRKPRVVYQQFNDVNKGFDTCGLYQFTFRDLFNTLIVPNKYGKEEFAKVDAFFEEKGTTKNNEYSDMFKGKNVIAVMLEGIDTWMVDKKHTPTIYKMMNEGINFTNYHSPFFGTGHTFNAEFAFNTGYFTPRSAVSAVNFSSNAYPYSLANLFKDAGYTVNSFHYNDSEFYNRGIMHKSFGYEKYHSFTDFGLPETVSQADSNILTNDEIYNKMVDAPPFFSFVITYSAHVPYTFDDAKLAVAKKNHPELINPYINKEKNNCLILAADTDDFFKMLLDRLKADGILEDTVIVAYTDHYAYGFSDQELLKSYKKGENIYRVPAFIYCADGKAKRVQKPMMPVDWLPTLANLFGLSKDVKALGSDVLAPENSGFVYFGDSSWLDHKMFFDPSEDTAAPKDKEYVNAQNNRVKKLFEINDIVISGDYYAKR